MKKIIVIALLLLCVSAYADDKYQKGYATQALTTAAQVFTKDVVLYGFDVITDGTNALEFELYDTSDYRGAHVWSGAVPITGGRIGPKYYITTSASDRAQTKNFAIPVQTTAGGVYIKFYTNSIGANSVTLYYDYSKYRGYDQ